MTTLKSETKRKTRVRPELSIFDEELNVQFNPVEFLPDVPSHARVTAHTPEIEPSSPALKSLTAITVEKVEPILSQSEAKVEPNLGHHEIKPKPKLSHEQSGGSTEFRES